MDFDFYKTSTPVSRSEHVSVNKLSEFRGICFFYATLTRSNNKLKFDASSQLIYLTDTHFIHSNLFPLMTCMAVIFIQ